jgi:hypothetical protein
MDWSGHSILKSPSCFVLRQNHHVRSLCFPPNSVRRSSSSRQTAVNVRRTDTRPNRYNSDVRHPYSSVFIFIVSIIDHCQNCQTQTISVALDIAQYAQSNNFLGQRLRSFGSSSISASYHPQQRFVVSLQPTATRPGGVDTNGNSTTWVSVDRLGE